MIRFPQPSSESISLSLPTTPATTSHWQRWAKWNLVRNPFGECTRQERAELAVLNENELGSLERFCEPFCAHQWIGDCGRGKTTRMLALHAKLANSCYVYLAEDAPMTALPAARPLMIDEAQRMPRRVADLVFRSGIPLVLATHRDWTRRLRRFGYHVTTDKIEHQNTPTLIHRALNRRIEASRSDVGPIPEITMAQATRLHQRFGTDLRAIEGHLYESWQTQLMQSEPQDLNHGQV